MIANWSPLSTTAGRGTGDVVFYCNACGASWSQLAGTYINHKCWRKSTTWTSGANVADLEAALTETWANPKRSGLPAPRTLAADRVPSTPLYMSPEQRPTMRRPHQRGQGNR